MPNLKKTSLAPVFQIPVFLLQTAEAPKLPPLAKESREAIQAIAAETKRALAPARSAREFAEGLVDAAHEAGFADLKLDPEWPARGLHPGERYVARDPGLVTAIVVVGRAPVRDGIRVVAVGLEVAALPARFVTGAGLDFLEDLPPSLAGQPLALIGEAARPDGTLARLRIGDSPKDPLLRIAAGTSDADVSKALAEYTARVLPLLADRFALDPADLLGATLEFIPVSPPSDEGTAESPLLSAWGCGSRAAAFIALRALSGLGPESFGKTAILIVEEARASPDDHRAARFLETVVGRLMVLSGEASDPNRLAAALRRSRLLVAGTVFATVPAGPAVERPWLGFGPAVARPAGSPIEPFAEMRRALEEAHIPWQPIDPAFDPFTQTLTETGMSAVLLGLPVWDRETTLPALSPVDLFLFRASVASFCALP